MLAAICRPGRRALGFWPLLIVIVCFLGACDDDDPMRSLPPAIAFDTAEPFCSLSGATCDAPVELSFRVGEGFEPDSLSFVLEVDLSADGSVDQSLDPSTVLDESHPDYAVNLTLPLGSHAMTVEMTDRAGEVYTAEVAFAVVDCKAPAPICINGLAVELQPMPPETDVDGDGDFDAAAMTVFASDFIASPVTDCSDPVRYSINRVGQMASLDATSLILTCDDVGTLLVEIHAWDSALGAPNHDFCETYVLVQDNAGSCAP